MSGLKIRLPYPYPDPVVGGAGIDVVKANGHWTISLDWSKFGIVNPYTPKHGDFVLIFDPLLEDFVLVPSESLTPPPAVAPTVTAISPTSGPAAGGTSVTITGTDFTGTTAVAFGATSASFAVNSPTQITTTSPAESAGVVDVTVTTAGGTSATSSSDQFTFTVPAPAVTLISPTSGPAAGGTSVIITGTNFTGATAVAFGGAAATSFTVNSSTQITVTSPAGSAGVVDVKVTTPGGTSATSGADQFTYVAPLTWDPATVANVTLSSGNLAATNTSTGANQGAHVPFTSAKSSGKYYFEIGYVFANTGANTGCGIGTTSATYTGLGNTGASGAIQYPGTGNIWISGFTGVSLGGFTTATYGIAVDLNNNRVWFRVAPSGNWNASGTANPATNIGGLAITTGSYVPYVVFGTGGTPNCTFTANFGASAFSGTVPSGFTSGWPS